MEQRVTRELKRNFDGTLPGEATSPCCKSIKARLQSAKFTPSAFPELVGDPESQEVNPDGSFMERGVKFTQRVKFEGTVTIKLRCICQDDGRELKSVVIEKKVSNMVVPLSYTLKPKYPYEAPLRLLAELYAIDKHINDALGGDPTAAQRLRQMGIDKAMQEIREQADNYCKNANPCSGG